VTSLGLRESGGGNRRMGMTRRLPSPLWVKYGDRSSVANSGSQHTYTLEAIPSLFSQTGRICVTLRDDVQHKRNEHDIIQATAALGDAPDYVVNAFRWLHGISRLRPPPLRHGFHQCWLMATLTSENNVVTVALRCRTARHRKPQRKAPHPV